MSAIFSLSTLGKTTIEFMSASAPGGTYRLAYGSFAPPVPERSTSLIRRGILYKPSVWDFSVNIHAATAPAAYAAYGKLAEMLEVVSAWRIGEVDQLRTVIVSFRPEGSSRSTPLTTVIREILDISTPKSFLEAGGSFVIKDIRIRFVTVPGYYDTSISDVATGSYNFSTINQTNLSFFHETLSPMKYRMALLSPIATNDTQTNRATFFASSVNKLSATQCVQVGGFGSNGYTSVVDSAGNFAPYNMLRWTPPGAGVWYAVPGAFTRMYDVSQISRFGTYLAYVHIRANNNVPYKIRARFSPDGSPVQVGREVAIPYNNGAVQLLYLGAFNFGRTTGNAGGAFNFELYADTASGTVDALTMYTIMDQPTSMVVTMDLYPSETLTSREFLIDPRLVGTEALLRPEVAFYNGVSRDRNLQYEGNAYPLMWGQIVQHAMVLGRGTLWRLPNATSAAPSGYGFTGTRSPAYLSPF
jgi:hypothetical protein